MSSIRITRLLATLLAALPVLHAQDCATLRDDGTSAPAGLVRPPPPPSNPCATGDVSGSQSPFPVAGRGIADNGSPILIYQHSSAPSPDAPGQVKLAFASDNGAAGNMFNMTPTTDLQITGLDCNLSNLGDNCVIALWTRVGSYVGHENSSLGWSLIGLASAVAAGTDQPTHFDFAGNNTTFSALTTYALYVDFTNIASTASLLRYTTGSTSVMDPDMTLSLGVGIGGPSFTGAVFTPRTWNGTIYYNTGSSAQGVLGAHAFGGSGFDVRGTMFDVTPKRDLVLTGVDIEQAFANAPTKVDVWYRTGSYLGGVSTPAGWTHLESGEVSGSPPGTGTSIDLKMNHLHLSAFQTYGFYVDLSSFDSASSAIRVSSVPQSTFNQDLTYASGASKGTPAFTGATFPNETFHGAIRYVTSGESGMNAGPFAGGNQSAGNMFDVKPNFDLFMTGMDVNVNSTEPSVAVEVWWTDTTYVGKEGSATGWSLLAHQTVAPRPANTPTFVDLSMSTKLFRGGSSYGVYVALSSYGQGNQALVYTNGSIIAGDAGLSMGGGVGKGHPLFTGNTITNRIWNGTIFYKTIDSPQLFCSAKLNSLGCYPLMDWSGVPSATKTNGFEVICNSVRNQKTGLLFYTVNGTGLNTPFQGGTLCVGPANSIKRTPAIHSGGSTAGSSDCTGRFQIDMNAFSHGLLGGTPKAGLKVPGNRIWVQWWGRDPGFAAPNNSTLSDAMFYYVKP